MALGRGWGSIAHTVHLMAEPEREKFFFLWNILDLLF
jgi:hypothetical protein